MKRRTFIKHTTASAAALMLTSTTGSLFAADKNPRLTIPRWRGFNLTEMANPRTMKPFVESDLQWMSEFGFNFARIPMSYWCWSDPKDWYKVDESVFEWIDQVIAYGKNYGIHINLNFHRIPGYCVNGRELEPCDLFQGPVADQDKALEAAAFHWRTFAKRYKGISSKELSFDLMNEPPWMDDDSRYVEIIQRLVSNIREIDPDRLIAIDGSDIGQTPVQKVADMGLVQSTRGYLPKMVSHYTATWVPENEFESFEYPTWPMHDKNGLLWDRERIKQELIAPWLSLVEQGVPVHVGEWGCYNKTPHDVTLAWMEDMLSIWKELGWGWAMWNFRGSFGVFDSGREDVKYEDFRGQKLDREMLELLKRY